MPPGDRFDKLERSGDAALPKEVQDALSRLSRFQALEIGATPKAPPAPAAAPSEPSAPPGPVTADKVPCVHCGQLNEKARETCWACYRFVRVKAPPQQSLRDPDDITLVLDGITYTSNQPNLPADVRELFTRIHKSGYSQQLLADWRAWRADHGFSPARAPAAPPPAPVQPPPRREGESTGSDEALGIKVFRGQRVSVIRLDGKVFSSDDPNLTPELKQLFAYLDSHGVTPALMDYLRQMGGVKLRPPTTAFPSDGDLAFWDSVQQSRHGRHSPVAGAAEELERRQMEYDLQAAQRRVEETRARAIPAFIGLALFALYLFITLFLR